MGSGGVDETDREGIPDGTDFFSCTRRIKDRDARLKRFIGGLVLARTRKSPSFSSLTPGAIYRLGPKRRKKRTDTGGYSWSRLGHSLDRKRSNSEEIVNGIE